MNIVKWCKRLLINGIKIVGRDC